MEYRRLGNAGMKVSAISIGAWLTFGSDRVAYEAAEQCIHTAIEHGINFLDCADAYSAGDAETTVGKIVKGYKRSDLVVSTKAYWPMSDNINDRGLSRKHLTESVHKSLKRLDMDYLDIFFCHRYDEETPTEETVRAIEDLIRDGKILYWGTSMWTADNITEALEAADQYNAYRPVTEQPLYNMLDRDVVEGELEQMVAEENIGLVVWSPLAQGVLTGKYNDGIPEDSRANKVKPEWFEKQIAEDRISRVKQLSELAQEMGISMSSLALAWAMAHPNVSSVITGASRREQVEENLKALDVEITDDINERIEGILQNKPDGSQR